MEFTIDRSKWLCGKFANDANGESALYYEKTGRQCCLGILAESCGIPKDELKGKGLLSAFDKKDLPNVLKFMISVPITSSTDRERDYVNVNDEKDISQREREKKLTDLFKEDGITVKFIGRLHGR